MSDCGHRCCRIRDNAFHGHTKSPEDCDRCAVRADDGVGDIIEQMTPGLSQVVTSVIERAVPGISGLPTGEELHALVQARALDVFFDGLIDPDLQGLDSDTRRTILVTRVTLALAFPHA